MFDRARAIPGIGDPGLFLPRLQRSVLLSPLIIIGALCLLFLDTGQAKEVLLRVVEPGNTGCGYQLTLGFVAFLLLAVTLFYSYLSSCVLLRKMGIGYGSSLIYESDIELKRDRRIVWIRDLAALACAGAPLMTVGYLFWHLSKDKHLDGDLDAPWQLCVANPAQIPAQLAHVALGWLLLSAVFLLGVLLAARLELRGGRGIAIRVTRTRLHPLFKWFAATMLLVPIPLINLNTDWHVELFQNIGPLATLGFVLMATASLLFTIGEWSKKLGIPFFTITAVVVFVFGLYSWATSVPDNGQAVATRESVAASARMEPRLVDWLKKRKDAVPSQPYPVYILAAPGGGIYAASFVASALARLERDCPGFSQHIFAISAVSGGAIGSAIVNAAEQKAAQVPHVNCDAADARGDPRMALVRSVLSEDHLSPMLAATVPDVIVRLFEILLYEGQRVVARIGRIHFEPVLWDIKGRTEALQSSFSEALRRACRETLASQPIDRIPACKDIAKNNPFDKPFVEHWQPDARAPALLLNTTWAETGDRVAFAPFSLEGVGDGTLRSVSDLNVSDAPIGHQVSLIEAAISSARFPAVLPAKILHPSDSGRRALWWNFVDGGYADASGTTTGLEIYKAIEARHAQIAESAGIPFHLKLVVLTDPSTNPEPGNPSGAGLIHAISPITTLLAVREQIGRRAVARAVREVSQFPGSPANSLEWPCQHVERIVLIDGTLPLGWMLSHYTARRIDRLMMKPDSRGVGITIADNEATFRRIRESMTGRCATGP